MKAMRLLLCAALVLCVLAPGSVSAKTRWTNLRVIVEDEDGDPIARASVVIARLKGKKLKKIAKGLQLKTSQRGTAPLPPLKQGPYLLQVINQGYQTFGGRIDLSEEEQTVTVTLKKPRKQFSVHAK